MNLRIMVSGAPVLVFYLVQRSFGAVPGIAAGFLAFCIVYWLNRRTGVIGALALFGFVVVTITAAIGLATDSAKAYLLAGPITDFMGPFLHLGSAFVLRKPVVGLVSRELVPAVAGRLPADHPVFLKLSVCWACYDIIVGTMRLAMLQQLSVGEYLVWSRLATWPLGAGIMALTGLLIYRAARTAHGGPLFPGSEWRVAGRRVVI